MEILLIEMRTAGYLIRKDEFLINFHLTGEQNDL